MKDFKKILCLFKKKFLKDVDCLKFFIIYVFFCYYI